MNPSTADIVAAIEATPATEVLVLPNNSNVILSAEQAAKLVDKQVRVIPSRSVPAGLAAIVRYLPTLSAEENEAAMLEALDQVATGEVTVASRDVELDGVDVRKGAWLGPRQRLRRRLVVRLRRGRLRGGRAAARRRPRGADAAHRRGRARSRRDPAPARGAATRTSSSTSSRAGSRTTRSSSRPSSRMVLDVEDGPQPIRVLLVEDNDVFRQALELLLELQDGIEVVGAIADGNAAVAAYREHRPDVVVMDFRLPGIDGVETTSALVRRVPGGGRRLPDRVGEPARARRADRRGRDRLPAQGRGARRDRRRDPAGGRGAGAPMNLNADNTAIVLDSTADFPDAQIRFPNMRVVPLYVRFGDESFRDYVDLDPHDFYARLRTATELPTTSQPTPQDFVAVYDELAGYERIYSLHISAKLSGTFQSAALAAADEGDRIRLVDTETASVGIAMLALAIQELPRARHDRRGGRGADRPLPRALGDPLHRRHARVPRQGRPDRARARR